MSTREYFPPFRLPLGFVHPHTRHFTDLVPMRASQPAPGHLRCPEPDSEDKDDEDDEDEDEDDAALPPPPPPPPLATGARGTGK